MTTVPLDETCLPALRAFLGRLPEGDVTFIKEDVLDEHVVAGWLRESTARRWVELADDGTVVGMVSVLPQTGWSSHVGEVRLVVDPDQRGQGLGRRLARHVLVESAGLGLTKLFVEVVAESTSVVRLFRDLGYDPEALLVDHIRDRKGELRDLMVLAHALPDTWAAMGAAGIEEAVA